jgi:hypothetical protein
MLPYQTLDVESVIAPQFCVEFPGEHLDHDNIVVLESVLWRRPCPLLETGGMPSRRQNVRRVPFEFVRSTV